MTGERSWMLFAERMMAERDTARESVFHLRAKVDELIRENTRLRSALDEHIEALAAEWTDRMVIPEPKASPLPAPPATFPDLLTEAMTAKSMTQMVLAAALTHRGKVTSRQAVSSWVRGASKPSPDRWATLLHVLQVSKDDQPRWINAMTSEQPLKPSSK